MLKKLTLKLIINFKTGYKLKPLRLVSVFLYIFFMIKVFKYLEKLGLFGIIVVVAIQSNFHLKIYQNNIF